MLKEKIKLSRDDGVCACRFGWYPKLLAFFITGALGLSVMSSLDCKFLEVELGFTPQNYYSDSVGFGLWTYAGPDGRSCLTYSESRQSGGFSEGDSVYSTFFINNDVNWSIARILAVVGGVFGLVAWVSIVINICNKNEPRLVDVLAYTTITAFMTECSKFGLFLGTDLCHSSDYWYNDVTDDFFGTKDCTLDRGAWMSICSMGTYFVSMVMSVGYAARPKGDNFSYEEASLPSWMASEHESSAKAQVAPPPDKPPPPAQEERRGSSMSGYDWSRSGRSMLASSGIEDYGLHDDVDEFPSPQDTGDQMEPIPAFPPPAETAPKKYDDMSTLTWDPGY